MQTQIFREYDIRGVAARDLDDPTCEAIGLGLGALLGGDGRLGRRPRVVVGKDCRSSGPRIFAALTRGLLAAGVDVLDIGLGPTPLCYFAVHHLDADGGVMITGSHNPGPENGFKIMKGKASFFGADIEELRDGILAGRFTAAPVAGALSSAALEADYLAALTRSVPSLDTGLSVVVDAGNGAAGPLCLRALAALGVTPTALYCDMDGTFPNHHPDPTVLDNLRDLIDAVRRQGARVGLAFDGDGDRLGVVDATGEVVWGDRLLALFAREVLRAHPGSSVIGEVKCSQALYDDIAAHGGRPIMWKTGHSLIKTKMKEEHALLAGEMSGHFFFADRYFGYDDGIYAALRVLEILSRTGKTVRELLADLPQAASTPELRVVSSDQTKRAVIAAVRDHYRGKEQLSEIDGVRVHFADGAWALARASNTGPVIVLRFEAPTEARLGEIRAEVEALVAAASERLSRAEA